MRLLLKGAKVPISSNVRKFALTASGKIASFVFPTITTLYACEYIMVNSILFYSLAQGNNIWLSNCKWNTLSRPFSIPRTYSTSLFGLDLEREGAQPFNFEGIDGMSEFLGWVYKHSHGPVSCSLSNFYVVWMLALPLNRSSFGWDRFEQFFRKIVGISPIYCDTWMIITM
jgi:hypothetical protein